MNNLITVKISAQNNFDSHKMTVEPSVVVNPPAIQYFKGINHDYRNNDWVNTDNREKEMKEHLIDVLSSDKYPNPQVCSKDTAIKVAKMIPVLLKKIKHKPVTVEGHYSLKNKCFVTRTIPYV